MSFVLSIFPIVLLIYLMVKRNALPSYVALPWIATLVMGVHLLHFNTDIVTISANVVSAIIAVQTPITVIFGAILFNRFSEISGATDTMRKWLGNINPNPVAQLMIIGWAFAFMIEGASGFGTPAAIAAPILVGLGFHPLKSRHVGTNHELRPSLFWGCGNAYMVWFRSTKTIRRYDFGNWFDYSIYPFYCRIYYSIISITSLSKLERYS